MSASAPGAVPLPASPEVAFVTERFVTFNRWKQRALWIVWIASGAAFLATIVLLLKIAPGFAFGFVAGIAVAFVVYMLMLWIMVPRLPAPSLRCPHCSGRVPLFRPAKFAQPLKPLEVCPNCQAQLPP